ncbi:3-isopropylmalate dehydratase large subunit [Desulfomonile tiedjei]|uniref:3-isopropylmalate dehydratase large subunit n=1 Tax=Desulfomonile tiedjei (strain ATCC 49306 / DSM 6799 / DCB-1) TaxID=706587 RepID=I4C139_DESTA|nr:3-isopropylmalate dehydratase large subunit [Desulfomonile tiedjei]AFM23280.1 3-isopropylmalate dehydratase, large subunit [Desulfomonile tiedjei DSM 6799]
MGMTITEKILAAHADMSSVEPGQLISARVDIALANDITLPLALEPFREAGGTKVFDPAKVVVVLDHFNPAKDIASAQMLSKAREFARELGLIHFYDVGVMGIEHVLLPEQGLVVPGDLVVGADSHTCTYGALAAFSTGVGSTDFAAAMLTGKCWFKVPETMRFVLTGKPGPWVCGKDVILHIIGEIGVDGALYKSMEFSGEGVAELSMSDRFTISNMAIEAGAKNGIFPFDRATKDFADVHGSRPYVVQESDPDAVYEQTKTIDLGSLEPVVALPFLPSNVRPVSEVKGMKVDQVVIGSCTNGRIEDLRIAASILKGRKVAKGIRLIVIPATPQIMLQAISEGLVETILQAGGAVSTPTCGPCLGGYMGILAQGERAVSTTNRNFVGRMGHVESEVVLASPAVAAATAVQGSLGHPGDL